MYEFMSISHDPLKSLPNRIKFDACHWNDKKKS